MIIELRIHVSQETLFHDADYHIKRLMEMAESNRPFYLQIYNSGKKGKLKTRKGTGLSSINQPKPACSLFSEAPND